MHSQCCLVNAATRIGFAPVRSAPLPLPLPLPLTLPVDRTQRLQAAVTNYLGLLASSRNLDFFTSFYRYLIQLLPAAVVAPLFFRVRSWLSPFIIHLLFILHFERLSYLPNSWLQTGSNCLINQNYLFTIIINYY